MGCFSSIISLLLIIFFFISVFHRVHAGIMLSPSPSPTPATQPPALHSPCDDVSDKCDIQSYRVTACVIFAGNGSSYISVVNKGGTSLQLHMIVVHPPNAKLEGSFMIPAHQLSKVNLPSHIGGGSSVVVKVGNDQECTIHLIPQGFYTSYLMPYMTARNGTYLLFAAAFLFLMGGSWALVKKTRHFDGVPYRELEFSSTIAIEAEEGWDQSWDDDDHEWDEEEAAVSVRSPWNVSEI